MDSIVAEQLFYFHSVREFPGSVRTERGIYETYHLVEQAQFGMHHDPCVCGDDIRGNVGYTSGRASNEKQFNVVSHDHEHNHVGTGQPD